MKENERRNNMIISAFFFMALAVYAGAFGTF